MDTISDLTGWTLVRDEVFQLWLSPDKTRMLQWYNPLVRDRRVMRSCYGRDMDYMLKTQWFAWTPRVLGDDPWEFQILHDFTGCEFVTELPPEHDQITRDFDTLDVVWPSRDATNYYRDSQGQIRVFGAYLAFQKLEQPVHMNFWLQIVPQYKLEGSGAFWTNGALDFAAWAGTPVPSGEAAVAPTPKN